jgi:F-type H+-transporting ATPase subunit a
MDGIGEKLLEKIKIEEIFSFELFGYEVIVSNSIVVMWIVMVVLIILSKILTKNFKTVPEGSQNFIEMVVDSINSFTKEVAGHHWKIIAPYVGTVFIFLIAANTISIFNLIPEWEQLHKLTGLEFFNKLPKISFTPPTRDINVNVALGLVSVIMVTAASIKRKKISGWLKSYIEPVPVILPMKIMENFIRMFSLAFRLFGNVLAAFIIMELVYIAIPLILPAGLSIYFDLFDGILQAFIFVFLTLLYMAEAVE